MNKERAKVYYEILTGDMLTVTGETQGVDSTTKEQDIKKYKQLNNKSVDEIDYIELEYGTLISTFTNLKSCIVNLETKNLECVYYTEEELNQMYHRDSETQDLNSRVSDISAYLLGLDESNITDIEDSIIEIEKNKITNGGM